MDTKLICHCCIRVALESHITSNNLQTSRKLNRCSTSNKKKKKKRKEQEKETMEDIITRANGQIGSSNN